MYFDGAEDGDWAELGNWWLDSGHTVAAPSLPAAGDSVIATATISDNSGGAVTVVNFTIGGAETLSIAITVTGMATFNDTSTNAAAVDGDATFSGNSVNVGAVTGTATFTGSAVNCGGTAGTFVPDPPPSC
jgi:hypothetical protein